MELLANVRGVIYIFVTLFAAVSWLITLNVFVGQALKMAKKNRNMIEELQQDSKYVSTKLAVQEEMLIAIRDQNERQNKLIENNNKVVQNIELAIKGISVELKSVDRRVGQVEKKL